MGVERDRTGLIRSGNLPRDERFQILQKIYDSFMRFDADFVRRANAYVEAGIIDVCYSIEREDNENDKIKVVYILGMVCFNNESATDKVGAHRDFHGLLLRTLDKNNPNSLLRAGLYLMTNASSNSFSTHPTLVKLLPRIREIIDKDTGYNQGTRSEGVRVCFYLASNEQTKEHMINAGVIEPLVDIMSSGVLELDCVSAAIAVANLVGDEEDSPALSAAAGAQGFYKLLVDALEASLNGTDYPVGSNLFYRNWKVVQGLANLSKADINKERLGACGLIPQLKRCLDQDDTDGRLHEFTMQTLWQLSFHEANHTRLRENASLRIEVDRLMEHGATEEIRRAAQGIIWQISKEDKPERKKSRLLKALGTKPTRPHHSLLSPSHAPSAHHRAHIMCSYSWQQQPMIMRVKETLEREGFSTWMDVDDMSGSTLEAMASAVENADYVVVGISKDYKNSGACRTECEFACKLNKPLVPLLLEADYAPDGWLGIMLGNATRFDLSSEAKFAPGVRALVRALGGAAHQEEAPSVASHAALAVEPEPEKAAFPPKAAAKSPRKTSPKPVAKVLAMNKAMVGEWLESVGLGKYVHAFANKDVDGESLMSAQFIAENSSYHVVKEDFQREFGMSFGDVYKFMWNLHKLCADS